MPLPSRPVRGGWRPCRWCPSGSRLRPGCSPHFTRYRKLDLREHPLRILRQVQPGEAPDLPAEQRDLVLPLAIVLKVFLAGVERPAVGLDGDLLLGKCDVDL